MSVSRLTTPSETTTDDTRAAGRRAPDARFDDARFDDAEPAGRSRRLRYTSALCRERPGDAELGATTEAFPEGEDEAVVCLLYTSDAADDLLCVDLGGR